MTDYSDILNDLDRAGAEDGDILCLVAAKQMRKDRDEIERLRAALHPFAAALSIAERAFDGPADRGYLEAIALTYVTYADLRNAAALIAPKEEKGTNCGLQGNH